MQTWQIVFDIAIVALGGLVILWLFWRGFKDVRKDFAGPIVRRRARVKELGVTEYSGRGLLGYPSHRTDRVVVFELGDGTLKNFLLFPEEYDLLHKGREGILITQGSRYVGFEEGAEA